MDAVGLAEQVILRAYRDLGPAGSQLFSDPATGRVLTEARADAKDFFLSDEDGWPSSLETWCAYAGLDPARVRAKAKELIEKGALV
jgi:hypothetical protein